MVINRMLLATAKPNRHLGLQAQLSWETSRVSCASLGTHLRGSQPWEDESEEAPALHSASFMGLNLFTCNIGLRKGS